MELDQRLGVNTTITNYLVLNVPKAMEHPGAMENANGRMKNAFPKVVFPMVIEKLIYSIISYSI